jgi:hypothetical protein
LFVRIPRPPPALVLFLLSPSIGELLSGSAPPAEFFTPFGLLILLSLYGGGALVVRELKVRWGKGMGSLLLLGAAYGILEEGLMVASFFNPSWPDLGQMAVYGRWLEVNWVWSVMLTIYHAVYSIAIPILLVELAYPDRRDDRWLGDKMFKRVALLLGTVVVVGLLLFSALQNYWPPALQYLLSVLAMLGVGYTAYRLPSTWRGDGIRPLPGPRRLWFLGTVATFAFFLGFWLMPELLPVWPAGILFGPLLVLLAIKLLGSYDWKGPHDREVLALVAGLLMFFIVTSPIQEMDATRTDNTTGMTLVGLITIILLLYLKMRVWKSPSITGRPNSRT